jgi:hypothetical protein
MKTILFLCICTVSANAKIGFVKSTDFSCGDTLPSGKVSELVTCAANVFLLAIKIDSMDPHSPSMVTCGRLEGSDTTINRLEWYADEALYKSPIQFNDDMFSPVILDTIPHQIRVINNRVDSGTVRIKVRIVGFDSLLFSGWLALSTTDSVAVRIFSGTKHVVRKDGGSLIVSPQGCASPKIMVLFEEKTAGIKNLSFNKLQVVPAHVYTSTIGTPGIYLDTQRPGLTKKSALASTPCDTFPVVAHFAVDSAVIRIMVQWCPVSMSSKNGNGRVIISERGAAIGAMLQKGEWEQAKRLLKAAERIMLFDLHGRRVGTIQGSGQFFPNKNTFPKGMVIFRTKIENDPVTTGKILLGAMRE